VRSGYRCGRCGYPIMRGANFCQRCGTGVLWGQPTETQKKRSLLRSMFEGVGEITAEATMALVEEGLMPLLEEKLMPQQSLVQRLACPYCRSEMRQAGEIVTRDRIRRPVYYCQECGYRTIAVG